MMSVLSASAMVATTAKVAVASPIASVFMIASFESVERHGPIRRAIRPRAKGFYRRLPAAGTPRWFSKASRSRRMPVSSLVGYRTGDLRLDSNCRQRHRAEEDADHLVAADGTRQFVHEAVPDDQNDQENLYRPEVRPHDLLQQLLVP